MTVLLQKYLKMAAEEVDVSLKSILKSKSLKSEPLAPSTIEIFIAYQLYKPYKGVTTIQLKPKRKKKWRGKRAGQKWQFIMQLDYVTTGPHTQFNSM